jgi:membrane fusion protein (multidrug efflux system)
VRVRAGQQVEAGTSLLELSDVGSGAAVTALLPGRYRPYLQPGAKLRFQLDGFTRRVQELTITRVGDQIVGPSEALRYLGRDLADSLRVEGPVVLVQALLPRATFDADDDAKLSYAHGMQGKAESAVRSEPLAYVLVPALKQWVERVKPHVALGSLWAAHTEAEERLP